MTYYIFRNAARHLIIDIDAKRELRGYKFCNLISVTGKITRVSIIYLFIYFTIYSRKVLK